MHQNEEWFQPSEIEFTQEHHISWLITKLDILKSGQWPKEPPRKPDGMEEDSELIGKSKIKARAYFETPIQFAVEIEERLDICRHDGQLLELVFRYGKTVEELSKRYHISNAKIRFRVEAALKHCTGGKRKRYYDRSMYKDIIIL